MSADQRTRHWWHGRTKPLKTNDSPSPKPQQGNWTPMWQIYIEQGRKNRERIVEILAESPNLSLREIAKLVGCSHQAVHNHKRKLAQALADQTEEGA